MIGNSFLNLNSGVCNSIEFYEKLVLKIVSSMENGNVVNDSGIL